MYYIREQYIQEFTQMSGIWSLHCACMVAAKKTSTKRDEMKDLVTQLKTHFEDVDKSIFKATQNVYMNAILGWKKADQRYSYLDDEETDSSTPH